MSVFKIHLCGVPASAVSHRLETAYASVEVAATPFDAEGGLGKMVQLFGDRMDSIMNELNEVLVA